MFKLLTSFQSTSTLSSIGSNYHPPSLAFWPCLSPFRCSCSTGRERRSASAARWQRAWSTTAKSMRATSISDVQLSTQEAGSRQSSRGPRKCLPRCRNIFWGVRKPGRPVVPRVRRWGCFVRSDGVPRGASEGSDARRALSRHDAALRRTRMTIIDSLLSASHSLYPIRSKAVPHRQDLSSTVIYIQHSARISTSLRGAHRSASPGPRS